MSDWKEWLMEEFTAFLEPLDGVIAHATVEEGAKKWKNSLKLETPRWGDGEYPYFYMMATIVIFEDGNIFDVKQKEVILGPPFSEPGPMAFPQYATNAFEAFQSICEYKLSLGPAGHLMPEDIVGYQETGVSLTTLVETWTREGLPELTAEQPIGEPLEPEALTEAALSIFGGDFAHGFSFGEYVVLLKTLHTEEGLWIGRSNKDLLQVVEEVDYTIAPETGRFTTRLDPGSVRQLTTWLIESFRKVGLEDMPVVLGMTSGPEEPDWPDDTWEMPLGEWLRFNHQGKLVVDLRIQGDSVNFFHNEAPVESPLLEKFLGELVMSTPVNSDNP